jgi:hypothetical protein
MISLKSLPTNFASVQEPLFNLKQVPPLLTNRVLWDEKKYLFTDFEAKKTDKLGKAFI